MRESSQDQHMMAGGSRSLMDFIDAPVLVGDPEGRAVYVNPAFEREFQTSSGNATGESLASLFSGGGREAVLRAVVQVCGGEPPVRFRLREGQRGWVALASPVDVDGGRVGVIILLTEEPGGEDRLQSLRRELLEPLDELIDFLGDFSEQTGGRRDESRRVLLSDGLRLIERMRKWASDIETEILTDRN